MTDKASSPNSTTKLRRTPAPPTRRLSLFVVLGFTVAVLAFAISALQRPDWNWRVPKSRTTTSAQPSSSSSSKTNSAATDSPEHLPTMSGSIRRQAPLVIPAVGKHTATVIFAHGLGDTGMGWAQAVEHWRRRPQLNEVKFVLPHAPMIPITLNGGMQMPGWFDIKSLGPAAMDLSSGSVEQDSAGILLSRTYFHSLVQEEITAGIPSERIALAGFSQGGAMSIFSGLTAPTKLAGIVGLSSWLVLHKVFKDHVPAEDPNKQTPVFMGHGDRDPLVRYELGTASKQMLQDMSYDVTMKTYRGMEHSACLEELDEVADFLISRLPPKE